VQLELRVRLQRLLGATVTSTRTVIGGDINDAFAVSLSDGRRIFVKTRLDAPRDTYRWESEALAFLHEARALRVAEVVAVGEDFLALTWIQSGSRARDFDEQLGRGLAALHLAHVPSFGLSHHNYVGSLPQGNTPCATYTEFYREHRLRPLVARAHAHGLLDFSTLRDFDTLYDRLEGLLGPHEPPARLHGDLWHGNVMPGEQGEPVLIDPAVYGGHREMDLAMLQLFAAPSARLLSAYDEVYPRAPASAGRLQLMQLYPLLVHVCLFGSTYTPRVLSALRSYL
jgi:fructosamine-3-kinase